MSTPATTRREDPSAPMSFRGELAVFVALAVLIWPVLAAGFVGGYGFVVWMWQIIFGPI